jgi:hypothetical protein
MASKKMNKGRGQEVTIVPSKGTGQGRYAYGSVAPSISTLTRQPLAILAKPKDDKSDFLLGLLREAGSQGITWAQMQQALKEKFGAAPKKRHSLYAILHGRQWYKVTGQRGIVTYHLGREPKKRGSKQA